MTAPKRVIWVVTPHASGNYDEWWGPAETATDHRGAYDYAQERLLEVWDDAAVDGPLQAVTVSRRTVTEEEYQEACNG